jgi:hypothetical protein
MTVTDVITIFEPDVASRKIAMIAWAERMIESKQSIVTPTSTVAASLDAISHKAILLRRNR